MGLSNDIRAEIAKIEARIEELKALAKKGVKDKVLVTPVLDELRELNVRLKDLNENLSRVLAAQT